MKKVTSTNSASVRKSSAAKSEASKNKSRIRSKKTTAPQNVDEYMVRIPEPARTILNQVRAVIQSTVPPPATETISYGIPTFKYKNSLLFFAGFKDHCSLFPGVSVIKKFKNELRDFHTSKGTIRFSADKPIPGALLKKMVRARIAESKEHL